MVCTLFQHCALPFLRRYLFYEKAPRVKCFAYTLLCWFAWQWLHKHVFCTQHTLRRRVASRNAASSRRNIAKIWKLLCYMRTSIWNLFPLLCVAPVNYTPRAKEAEWKAPNSDSNYPFPFFTRCLFSAIFFLRGRTDLCLLHHATKFPSLQLGCEHISGKVSHTCQYHTRAAAFFLSGCGGWNPRFPCVWMLNGRMDGAFSLRPPALSLFQWYRRKAAPKLSSPSARKQIHNMKHTRHDESVYHCKQLQGKSMTLKSTIYLFWPAKKLFIPSSKILFLTRLNKHFCIYF